MPGSEGIKPHPEKQIEVDGSHRLEFQNPTVIKMISLLGPSMLLNEKSVEGMTDDEIVATYGAHDYGYARFTRVEGELAVEGEEGTGRKPVFVDIKIPGTIYFNGVLEDFESYIRNSNKRVDPKAYESWAKRTREEARGIGATKMIHVQRNVGIWDDGGIRSMGNFDTFFFGPTDVLLQEGHPDVYNHSTNQHIPHPKQP